MEKLELLKRIRQLESELAEQKDFVSEGQDRLDACLVEKGNAFDKTRRVTAENESLKGLLKLLRGE